MQATPQGRKSGDINFADINAKELEFWSSTNPSVATVDENGLIKAVSLGKAEIIYELQIEKGVKQPARKSIIVKETAANLLPVIITDTELSVSGGETITLDASESYDDDGEITLFSWNSDKLGLIGISGEQVEISLPESNKNESYSIILEVTDNSGGISTETISISASATLPTAIGSANEAHSGEKITLNGSSSHFNGDTGAISGYKWEQINIDDGYTVELADTASQIVEFTAPELKEEDSDLGKELQFKLTVSNEAGKTASTKLTTKILNKAANIKPLALGGIESKNDLGEITLVDYLEVIEGDEVCLNGSDSTDPDVEVGSDVDSNGIISYRWSTVENYDITTINSARGCFPAPSTKENLSIEIELQVIDAESATGKKVVTLDVISQNKLPVIENISYQINNKTVYLSASVSDPDKDGSIVKYTWSENEPDISINNPTSATPTANAPIRKTDKTYTVKLTIEDDEGGETEKSIDITIPNTNLKPTSVVINHTYTNDEKEEYQTSFLTWDASDASEYKIYKSTSNLFLFGMTSTSTTSNTQFEITPELPNTTYYFKVSAIYPDGEESEHSTVQAYLPAPQDVVLVDDLKKLQFEWASVSGADSYTIECTRENSVNCSVICTESGSNVVAGTSCTHEEGIVTNAVEENTNKIISTKYSYTITPRFNLGNNNGIKNNSLSGYAMAGKWANLSKDEIPYNDQNYKSTSLDHNGTHKVYFLNDISISDETVQVLYEYSFESGTWAKSIVPEEYTSNFSFDIVSYKDKLLITGGLGEEDDTCKVIEYDTTNKKWGYYMVTSEDGESQVNLETPCLTNHEVLIYNGNPSIEDDLFFLYGGKYKNGDISYNHYMISLYETFTASPGTIPADSSPLDLECILIMDNSYNGVYCLEQPKTNNQIPGIVYGLASKMFKLERKELDSPMTETAICNIKIKPIFYEGELYITGPSGSIDDTSCNSHESLHKLNFYAENTYQVSTNNNVWHPINLSNSHLYEGKIYSFWPQTDFRESYIDYYDFLNNSWSKITSKPTPRAYGNSANVNGDIYTYGGNTNLFIPNNNLEKYSSDTLYENIDFKTPEYNYLHQNVVVDNKIITFGGREITNEENYSVLTTDIIDPINKNVLENIFDLQIRPHDFCVTSSEDNVYMIRNSITDSENKIFEQEVVKYSINRDKETLLESPQIISTRDISQQRVNFNCKYYNGKIYIIGGLTDQTRYQDIEIFNEKNLNWNKIGYLKYPRAIPKLEIIQNKLYIIGGNKESVLWGYDADTPINNIEIYDLANDLNFISTIEIENNIDINHGAIHTQSTAISNATLHLLGGGLEEGFSLRGMSTHQVYY